MLGPITNVSHKLETKQPGYNILNPNALKNRIESCVEKALGQNSLQQGCRACDTNCTFDGCAIPD